MATWEDGPEYAPHERPQGFAEPTVAPLEAVPASTRPGLGAPQERPSFDQPAAPVVALATLVPAPPDGRDPQRPFDVASDSLTGDSAWGSVHWNATQPFPVAAPGPSATEVFPAPAFPPPSTAPAGGSGSWSSVAGWPPPTQPFQVSGPVPGPGGPAPGTPGWFGPPAPYGDQPRPGRVGATTVVEAATPGLCICLAVGGLIYVLAPVMVVVGVVLSSRVQVAQRGVRIAFRTGAGFVGLVALIGLFSDVAAGSGWWHYVGWWSVLVCWVLLVVLLALVWSALRRTAAPPPGPTPWR